MIVVGVDESEGSIAALGWAVEEATLRKTALRVVHAWEYPATSVTDLPIDSVTLRVFKEHAEHVIDQMLIKAVGDPSEVEGSVGIERVVSRGSAAESLLGASQGADLLVVGSRGRGGFKSLLLGSVSQQCAQHATCPVVIVPNRSRIAGD
ncbi:MAG: universal stress protein [Acidimicrobiia bacterium]